MEASGASKSVAPKSARLAIWSCDKNTYFSPLAREWSGAIVTTLLCLIVVGVVIVSTGN